VGGGGTSEAVEEKAAEGMTLMRADHSPRGGRGGKHDAASLEGDAAQRLEAVGCAEPGVGGG
jgi:hypothetical protein